MPTLIRNGIVLPMSGDRTVRDVFVDGRHLVAGGQPATFDVTTVRAQAQAAAEELFERRAALDPVATPSTTVGG